MGAVFQPLTDFEPSRHTLHMYSRVVGNVPRRFAPPHPQWWHISLRGVPTGLVTSPIPLPDGNTLSLQLNLTTHVVEADTSAGLHREYSMRSGASAAELAGELEDLAARLGLVSETPPPEVDAAPLTAYDEDAVARYLSTLTSVDRIFKTHRSTLDGDCGPVQLWPHGFDLAFEWFGTRTAVYEEDGETKSYPSQLNLGFFPGGGDAEPYFYSNPFPFETEILVHQSLPAGATWHTEGWQGTYLPYAALVGDAAGEERLREFAARVYELARPTLTA